MKRVRSQLRFAFLPALALVAATCASSGDPSSVSAVPADASAPERTGGGVVTAPGGDVIRLSPVETAAALTDPATAESGVWSALVNLGIGVYTGSGERMLGGSETSEDDFWLYDFEVPALLRMATAPPRSFAITYSRISELGFDGTLDDLLRFYRDTYAAVPEAYLAQLFGASGIVFDGDVELTPFQEWLLMLDTFVPPNGTEGSQAANAGLAPVMAVTGVASLLPTGERSPQARPAAYQRSCGTIIFGTIYSNWGDAWKSSPFDVAAVEAYYAMHGLMLTSGVEATIEAELGKAHEGHDDDGKPVGFVVTVNLSYFPQHVVLPECGLLWNMDLPVVGPLRGVEVSWNPDDVLDDHGRYREGRESLTDSNGEAMLTYVPRKERDGGRGLEREDSGYVEATFNMKDALLAFVTEPRILMLVPERMPIGGEAKLEVGWHEATIEVNVVESQGTSLMEYRAWTCDGEYWQADFNWIAYPAETEIEMFANFDFELPEGGQAVNPVDAVGAITAAGVEFLMTIPYNFEFTLEQGADAAVVGIHRQPGGGVTGPVGGQVPIPAESFPEFQFIAPLEENLDCSG
jgi:hypothetical protein